MKSKNKATNSDEKNNNKGDDFPHLKEGEAVKNLKGKIAKIGRPSVFIGSVSESIWIANKIQSYFDEEIFEVDPWHQGVFELTKTRGGKSTNAEQLKNFTDIYDFAIFIFSPDDKIISQYRKDKSGKHKEALATRHNIVFEFGLFLGRIGAKRSFILFDDSSRDFIEDFFTDLKENIIDTNEISDDEVDSTNKFRLELYPYKGTSSDIKTLSKRKKEFDYDDLKIQVSKIQKRILKTFKGIDIGFLPSTSLAIGYHKNFIKIIGENMLNIVSDNISVSAQKEIDKNIKIQEMVVHLSSCEKIEFKIVIPNTIQEADPLVIKPFLEKCSERNSLPGKSRNMSINLRKKLSEKDKKYCIIYDVPTTMFSSVEAVEMLNPHPNVVELLSEKEKRNFIKVFKYRLKDESDKNLKEFMEDIIKFITWEEFLEEINNF